VACIDALEDVGIIAPFDFAIKKEIAHKPASTAQGNNQVAAQGVAPIDGRKQVFDSMLFSY
jgi:hypothetical protein